MSREHILHRVRTALGRSAGQPPGVAPPVRIRVPSDDSGSGAASRITTMLARVEALAGKTYRAATPEDARAFAWMMTHPRIYAWAGWMARHAPIVKVGPVREWTSQRDLPPMPRQSFRDLWSRRGSQN